MAKKKSSREPGYYWVLVGDDENWMVAKWDGRDWYFVDYEGAVPDVDAIGSKRLRPPFEP